MKNYRFLVILSTLLMTGCGVSSLWTGASLLYDRHHVYKKLDDYQLSSQANYVLFDDKVFKRAKSSLDLAVFNGDVLLAGHVPAEELRTLAANRLSSLHGYRELFNQVAVSSSINHGLEDGWITSKIRSRIFADASIDPNSFKIITVDKIVYVMGDVMPQQAQKVLSIARNTKGVLRVVKLVRYYHISPFENLKKP